MLLTFTYLLTLPQLQSVHPPSIYINNWIADRLFAKQPASEATEWPRPVLPWIVNHTSAIMPTRRKPVPTNHNKRMLAAAQVFDVLAW